MFPIDARLVQRGLGQNEVHEVTLSLIRNGKGAVAVLLKKVKGNGAFFGAAHVLLQFKFCNCVCVFVHDRAFRTEFAAAASVHGGP